MSEPVNTNDTSAETQDWADSRTTNIARMLAFFILPSIFVLIAIFAVFWGLTHQKKPAVSAPVAAASAPAVTDKDAQIAQLQAQILALQNQQHPAETPVATAPAQSVYSADPGALAQLSARLDRVEAAQRELAKATAAAYAARSLQTAAQGQQPFLSELAAIEPALNDPALSASLRPYAEKGVPSAISLAVAFPAIAARSSGAAQADDGKHGVLDNIRHFLGGFVHIRRIDGAQGSDATLLNAENRLNSGDLKGALAYIDTLPPSAQKALSPWLEQARARVLVDDATRRISETTLSRLSQLTNTQAAPTNGGVL
ncbi:MAG: hypothetical protein QM647_13690 [Asticcacaulis sp.]|uniref:COG4223 family protein n=1 Tax=Asticcacaulis sp. TaxID=1872648 RepID=UPI0039E42E1E